jgi:hypothetical protein
MLVFPSVKVETPFVELKRYAILNFTSKHHLIATHVVHHHVLQFWHEGLLIDKIKVNMFVSCNLNPDISFDIVDKTSDINSVVKFP